MTLDRKHPEPTNEAHVDVMQTARAWLVRLRDDDVSVEEIAEWQAWLGQSPENSQAYEQVERTWRVAAGVDLNRLEPTLAEIAGDTYMGDVPVAEAKLDDVTGPMPAVFSRMTQQLNEVVGWCRRQPLWASVPLAIGGMVALTFMVVVFTPTFTGSGVEETSTSADLTRQVVASIVTEKAEHRSARLFDGSQVAVGAASQVTVDFSQNTRQVSLESGEAYFDVAPDPDRPFVVTTPLGNVTAVGTAFNVRLAEDRVVVTVTEGKVDVRPARASQPANTVNASPTPDTEQAVRVEAGSAFTMAQSDSVLTAAAVVPALAVTWQDQRLVYRSEPLRYVVADINRYTPGRIELADASVGLLSYSGVISPDAIEDWAAGLSIVFPVDVDHRPGGVIRVRVRSPD